MESSTTPAADESHPLEIYFLPFLAPGHMIPLCEIAILFSSRGHNVTIITTPSNASLILPQADKQHNHLNLHIVPFPSKKVGLPDGLENFISIKDMNTASKIFTAVTLMRQSIEDYILSRPPDCIISDMFFPWTADLALRLSIPRILFQPWPSFAMSIEDAVRRPDSPHIVVQSDYEPFVIPNLPHPITMTRSQLSDYIRTPNRCNPMTEQWREAELKSYCAIVNNYAELDFVYTHHYQKVIGHKIFHLGPTTLIHQNAKDKVERSHKIVIYEHECMSWLNSKKPNSVLYVCFGSACFFTDDQLMEIACGLESAGHDFVWVVLGKDYEKKEDEVKWLPEGFEEKVTKCGRGMILKGWAPQVLILDHPSVAGFLSHCGWNSVIETVSAGVPMATWPLYSEQFYNEKLLTQVLGIGVEVGIEDFYSWSDAGKNVVITRDMIDKAVRRLMDGGDEAKERRRKTKELAEKAKRAVEEGGSSRRNLTVLIEDLKQLRDQKRSKPSRLANC